MRNPSVCLLCSQPPPLSGEILTSCQMLTFACSPNFNMLPERELAKSRSDFDWGLDNPPTRINFYLNPSVCSLRSQPPPLSGEILTSWQMLTFASSPNFFMLPERELAKSRSDFDWGLDNPPTRINFYLNPSVCSLCSQPPSPRGRQVLSYCFIFFRALFDYSTLSFR